MGRDSLLNLNLHRGREIIEAGPRRNSLQYHSAGKSNLLLPKNALLIEASVGTLASGSPTGVMSTSLFSSPTSSPPSSFVAERGRLTMVGAGPGDPELLTVAALRSISDPAALVISDRLVSKEILDLVRGEVRVANKNPGCADKAQNEIYKWCLGGLEEGKHVVRLKIGDPFVFGRGGEEVLKFRGMGFEPEGA